MPRSIALARRHPISVFTNTKQLLSLLCAFVLLCICGLPVNGDSLCNDPFGCVEVAPDDPIVVGGMLVVSGAVSYLGQDTLGGIELAILHRDGELLGHEIELVVEDSLCSAEGGQTAAQRLSADESIVGVIGTNCSSAAQGAMPIISDAGMVMIAPSNTSPSLTNEDIEAGGSHRPGYFRTSHNGLMEGMRNAEFATRMRCRGDINCNSTRWRSLYRRPVARRCRYLCRSWWRGRFRRRRQQGRYGHGIYPDRNRGQSDPDVIYLPLFEPEINFFAAQMQHFAGLEDAVIIGGGASFVAGFPENTGEAAVGIYISGPLVTGDAYEDFLETWDEEIGGTPPSGYHAHAYDATNILLEAVTAAAVELDDGGLLIGRSAIREALAATENYPGLTGNLTCQEASPFAGDCATGSALAMFVITEAEVYDDHWPPPVAWSFAAEPSD